MPNIITLPTATPTGLGQLGNVLFGAASDYAAQQRKDEDEKRRRAQELETHQLLRGEHLADVGSERTYQEQRDERQRQARLQDTEAEKLFAAKTEMMRLGLLKPADFDNADAVNAALGQMRNDGLLAKYKGALESGDLTYQTLASGNPEQINTGLTAYSKRLGEHTQRAETSLASGQARADQLRNEYDQTMRASNALDQELSRPVEQLVQPPSQQEVESVAVRLAQQMSGGKVPTPKDIAAQIPVAQQQLTQQRLEGAMLRRQQNHERSLALKAQAQNLGTQINTLANMRIFPGAAPASTAPSPLTDVGEPLDPNAARAATRAKLMRGADTRSGPQVNFDVPGQTVPRDETAVFGNLENMGVFQRPMMQTGRVRGYAPTTPSMVQSARTAVQAEIDRLNTSPQTRAVPGRLNTLTAALSDLDALQRGQDQTATDQAQALQEPPDSNAAETLPRAPVTPFSNFSSPRAWWTPQPAATEF